MPAGKEDPDQRIDEILDECVHNCGCCGSDDESDCEADDSECLKKIHEFFDEAFLLLGGFLHLIQSRNRFTDGYSCYLAVNSLECFQAEGNHTCQHCNREEFVSHPELNTSISSPYASFPSLLDQRQLSRPSVLSAMYAIVGVV